jgi:hypothetical protein
VRELAHGARSATAGRDARQRRTERYWRRRNAGTLKITKNDPAVDAGGDNGALTCAPESPAPDQQLVAVAEASNPQTVDEPAAYPSAATPASGFRAPGVGGEPSACAGCDRVYGPRSERLEPLDRTDSVSPRVCGSCWQACDSLAAQAGRIRPTSSDLVELRRQRHGSIG